MHHTDYPVRTQPREDTLLSRFTNTPTRTQRRTGNWAITHDQVVCFTDTAARARAQSSLARSLDEGHVHAPARRNWPFSRLSSSPALRSAVVVVVRRRQEHCALPFSRPSCISLPAAGGASSCIFRLYLFRVHLPFFSSFYCTYRRSLRSQLTMTLTRKNSERARALDGNYDIGYTFHLCAVHVSQTCCVSARLLFTQARAACCATRLLRGTGKLQPPPCVFAHTRGACLTVPVKKGTNKGEAPGEISYSHARYQQARPS